MSQFVFAHAGRSDALAWLRYKAKESLFLSLSLCELENTDARVPVLHNSVASKLEVTREFVSMRAKDVGLAGARLLDTLGARGRAPVAVIFYALLFFVLPLSAMQELTRRRVAVQAGKFDTIVVFFDGHLSGYILVRALKSLGIKTATLQHGLYRSDDVGSRMALVNFSSDIIFLWEELTRYEFLRIGVSSERLRICGQYGFSHLLVRRSLPKEQGIIAFCPAYDTKTVAYFLALARTVPSELEIRYSLHPIFAKATPWIRSEPLAGMKPRPKVSVCGDSAVILDSLASGVAVVSIGPRALATNHVFSDGASPIGADWNELISRAESAFDDDLRRFGFQTR